MRQIIHACALALGLQLSAVAAPMMLELQTGQKFEGQLQQVKNSQLVFKTVQGPRYTISMSTLSNLSQQKVNSWIRSQGGTLKFASWIKSPDSAFAKPWPRTVYGPANPPVKTRHDLSKNGTYVFESEHYQFISDAKLESKVVQRFSVLFETTYKYNMELPLNAAAKYEEREHKYKIYLFGSYGNYVRAGGVPRSAGVYISSKGVCLMPLQTLGVSQRGSKWIFEKDKDNSTITHELTHQLTGATPFAAWYIEGSAEYVATTPYHHAAFHVYDGKRAIIDYVTADKLKPGEAGRMLGRRFKMPKLSTFMTLPYRQFTSGDVNRNYGAALLLTNYFYHADGRKDAANIKKYIKTLQRGGTEAEALKALLNGRSFEEVQKSFAKYYAQSGVTIDFY